VGPVPYHSWPVSARARHSGWKVLPGMVVPRPGGGGSNPARSAAVAPAGRRAHALLFIRTMSAGHRRLRGRPAAGARAGRRAADQASDAPAPSAAPAPVAGRPLLPLLVARQGGRHAEADVEASRD